MEGYASREEYYHAYPKADADGWIEWKGGECPVYGDDDVDVVLVDGSTDHGIADEFDWHRDSGPLSVASYRLHKPEVKPEFCESVMRSIPEPKPFKCAYDPRLISLANVRIVDKSIDDLCAKVTEENKHHHIDTKPTIEQLAHDYRNAKDYALRLQKDAGEAAVKAESFAVEIRKKILELQELIG